MKHTSIVDDYSLAGVVPYTSRPNYQHTSTPAVTSTSVPIPGSTAASSPAATSGWRDGCYAGECEIPSGSDDSHRETPDLELSEPVALGVVYLLQPYFGWGTILA